MIYDVAIIGAGPGGIYAAYKLSKEETKHFNILVLEKGKALAERKCPMSEGKTSKCINCKPCSIMSGFGGAGAFSDGKFNITNDFGGNLWQKVGSEMATSLMVEIDNINKELYGKEDYPKMFSSKGSDFKRKCLQNNLHLLDADIRHLGTDKNYIILNNLYNILKDNGVEFKFQHQVVIIKKNDDIFNIETANGEQFQANKVIISAGRSGSRWLERLCEELNIPTTSNRVDIGVRVELPYEVFSHLTDNLYESKIVYKTKGYEDFVRTFCMNPRGAVVSENTNGIITVNGHSYEDPELQTKNTNFALLVSQEFTEPFNSSNEYGESIAKLSNMLGKGVIVQRYGDLIRNKRTTKSRLIKNTVKPTLSAEPGDLSLVLPHRILEDIKEMISQLNQIAPGTMNDDTLLYGVEVKFYNSVVQVNNELEADEGLYIIGDGSGLTHSLSQAAASGLKVAYEIIAKNIVGL